MRDIKLIDGYEISEKTEYAEILATVTKSTSIPVIGMLITITLPSGDKFVISDSCSIKLFKTIRVTQDKVHKLVPTEEGAKEELNYRLNEIVEIMSEPLSKMPLRMTNRKDNDLYQICVWRLGEGL